MGAGFALVNYAFDEIGNPALRPVEEATCQRTCLRSRTSRSRTSRTRRHRRGGARSLSVRAGEFIGIVGESGCGKSPALRHRATALAASGSRVGRVVFKGPDLVQLTENSLRLVRWRDVSFVIQSAMNALNPMKSPGAQLADTIRATSTCPLTASRRDRPRFCHLVGIDAAHWNATRTS